MLEDPRVLNMVVREFWQASVHKLGESSREATTSSVLRAATLSTSPTICRWKLDLGRKRFWVHDHSDVSSS